MADKSDGWDLEEANITGRIAAANILEHYAASNLKDPIEEVQEFEYIVEEGEAEQGTQTQGGGYV